MKLSFLLLLFVFVTATQAQVKLPIIKASAKTVSIRDGAYLYQNTWNLSPTARPDIYTVDRTRQTKWVTFYTDKDSIRIKVTPGSRFNFIILLNDKDSCFTQVASAIPPASAKMQAAVADTIPFTVSAYNAISVKAIINDTASFDIHFDLSAFDFRLLKDVMKARLPKISTAKVQLGTLIFPAMSIRGTDVTSHDMQGRFGWNLFDGKIVQIDYDKHLLIISNTLPATKGYQQSAIDFIQSFVCVKGCIAVGNKNMGTDFLLDNGSDQAVIMDSTFAAQQNFAQGLPLIRTSVLHDPRGVKYETKVVLAPKVSLGKYSIAHVPTMILAGKNPVGIPVNYLGNDYLKRFNLIVDFTTDKIYFKPNGLWAMAFKDAGNLSKG